jgi:alpha-L-rhamnosidase
MKNAVIYILCMIGVMAGCGEQATIQVSGLRCEQLVAPMGIDRVAPRLSWEIGSDSRDIQQTAYQVLVASSLEKLNANEGDLWDSQKVNSSASVNVPYGGQKLESRAICFWKVKVITNRGSSEWSPPAQWSMALMNATDWQAKWTGLDRSFEGDVTDKRNTRLTARYFRKEFDAAKMPVKATVYVSGLGFYKLYVNGKEIGEQELAPTPTDYTKVVKYNTFDVTDALKQGKNAVGVVLGNGRYFSMRQSWVRHFGFPKMILQMEVTYGDGSRQTGRC